MPANHLIRNFCIIAHIDHGKSTLADRFLQITKTIPDREMKEQVLDRMDLERERGITIKLQPVRMNYQGYELNLIDTPGHVDFNYEVSRSLACVEGAILVVDATQGIEAQTLANLYLALDQNLTIIPVLNKIDLPQARIEEVSQEVAHLLGCQLEDIIAVSAKTGQNVEKILAAVITKVPPPIGDSTQAAQALIFDSYFDDYRGVVAFCRMKNGSIKAGDKVLYIGTGQISEVLEVGYFKPDLTKNQNLQSGETGYLVSGLKEIDQVRVGDTITLANNPAKQLPGYKEIKPMVFASIFPRDGSDFEKLRKGIGKLKLNDAALTYEPENFLSLGFGFRCGFLGLLHLEIFQERLKREFGLDLITTAPSVAYQLTSTAGQTSIISHPQDYPANPSSIAEIKEPFLKIDIVTPVGYIGNIMQLMSERRGVYLSTEYLDVTRAILRYEMPLAVMIIDFYDDLKSISSGYASLSYEIIDFRPTKIVKIDVMVAEEIVPAFSSLTYEDSATPVGRRMVGKLKNLLPRQMFEVKIQAAINGHVIASERISAMKKDVIAKLYGGDVTRKRKLLEKQKAGKKKMKSLGRVDIPSNVYLEIFKK